MDDPLHEAFLEEIADMYNAEKQLIKALPKMAKAARSEELREAFESQETEQQAQRIEEAMEWIGGITQKRKNCKGTEGSLAEGKEMMTDYKEMIPHVRNAEVTPLQTANGYSAFMQKTNTQNMIFTNFIRFSC